MRVVVPVVAWVLALAFALVLAMPAGVADAQPASDESARSEAAKAFADGQAADKRKDYRTAIEHYLRAYELKPHHFALYNIGLDYERLGELREAAAWFERYVREAPESPELDRVQKLLGELKLRPAALTVTSNVGGARVFIDGRYSGTTPFTKAVRGGQRRITVESSGRKNEEDVLLEYGEPKSISVDLDVPSRPAAPPTTGPPHPGTVAPGVGPTTGNGILEMSGPDGAFVAVDGRFAGKLPSLRIEVPPGTHRVTASSIGFEPFATSVIVEAGRVTPVTVAFGAGTPTTPTDQQVLFGYLIGFGGGLELRDAGAGYAFEFGIRLNQYDLLVRYGSLGGNRNFDLLVRAALMKRKITPFIGAGVSYVYATEIDPDTGGSTAPAGALIGVGGIRWDLSRGTGYAATLMFEGGVRLLKSEGEGGRQLEIPILGVFQYTYGRSQ